jgi:hypothetical protein
MKTSKSIQITEMLHARLKEYCTINGLKLQIFVEKLIENELSKSVRPNCKTGTVRK